MAAKKKKAAKKQPGEIFQPRFFDVGQTVPIEVKKANEQISEYKLSDGTTMTLKNIILGVKRAVGKYNQEGDPIYLVNAGLVVNTKVPARLKFKGKQ